MTAAVKELAESEEALTGLAHKHMRPSSLVAVLLTVC